MSTIRYYHIEAPKSGGLVPLHPPRVYQTIKDQEDPDHVFKVIDPKEIIEGYEFFFHKDRLIECEGPARKLTMPEYVKIFCACRPSTPISPVPVSTEITITIQQVNKRVEALFLKYGNPSQTETHCRTQSIETKTKYRGS